MFSRDKGTSLGPCLCCQIATPAEGIVPGRIRRTLFGLVCTAFCASKAAECPFRVKGTFKGLDDGNMSTEQNCGGFRAEYYPPLVRHMLEGAGKNALVLDAQSPT